ncbi:MAG: hypothetical protein V7L02_23285 [Nostoc sp.]|uniref:hypothetical protein n=1 Tax=Nostoc sp. TaxID=1180 RepID=UPI002FF65C89
MESSVTLLSKSLAFLAASSRSLRVAWAVARILLISSSEYYLASVGIVGSSSGGIRITRMGIRLQFSLLPQCSNF